MQSRPTVIRINDFHSPVNGFENIFFSVDIDRMPKDFRKLVGALYFKKLCIVN